MVRLAASAAFARGDQLRHVMDDHRNALDRARVIEQRLEDQIEKGAFWRSVGSRRISVIGTARPTYGSPVA